MIYPHNFQKNIFGNLVSVISGQKNQECGLGFSSENDANSVRKIRFFKKSSNLDTIIRVGFFVQK